MRLSNLFGGDKQPHWASILTAGEWSKFKADLDKRIRASNATKIDFELGY